MQTKCREDGDAGQDGFVATFRFHDELNDFIAFPHRERDFESRCPRGATVKHMVEALGVPHTEVGVLLLDGKPVEFADHLKPQQHLVAYPAASLPLGSEQIRFVADAHLGGLARLLRMTGFDTLYDNHFEDGRIARLSVDEQRIVLSRDRDLLKRKQVTRGCYVRARQPELQLQELFARLQLKGRAQPFRLCLHCNTPLDAIDKEAVQERVPPAVLQRHQRFMCCAGCGRVYWEGTHWQRMSALLRTLRTWPENIA